MNLNTAINDASRDFDFSDDMAEYFASRSDEARAHQDGSLEAIGLALQGAIDCDALESVLMALAADFLAAAEVAS